MNEKIDFVIAWVDGNDIEWQKEKNKFCPNKNNDDRIVRYRDWDNLKYWFRGVEKYAPWVNKIFFVTYGHVPEWLNLNHPKLKIINHSDYMPNKYLPTFSSHTIELNLHKIKELSETFVYFNDDMFIINKVSKNDFFKNGIPKDSAILNPYIPTNYDDMSILCWNMVGIINSHFNKSFSMKKNIFKWINLKYGTKLLRTITMLPYPRFGGFYETHMPNSYKKSTLREVWKAEPEILDNTCIEKFRNLKTHVNQWIFRYWQIVKGEFIPRRLSFNKYYDISNQLNKCVNQIKSGKSKIICINDTSDKIDFESTKSLLNASFEKKFPHKSSFEK